MRDETTHPIVFISYSHKDERWKDLLLPHIKMLEMAGYETVIWDDRMIDFGTDWYEEILRAMNRATTAICLISADYLASEFVIKEEIPILLQRRREEGMLLIPVLIRDCHWDSVRWLRTIQMVPRDGGSVNKDYAGHEDEVFTAVAKLIEDRLIRTPSYGIDSSRPRIREQNIEICLNDLPRTGDEVFGRINELEILDSAWQTASKNIIIFIAWGGVGKSALVNKWLGEMSREDYRGAQRVYGWSFYSQGTGQRVTSSEYFVDHMLRWFGAARIADTNQSPWDKGRHLADLVREKRMILVLDGLEPLQSGLEYERGSISDAAVRVLVRELANENPGLCIITTRENIPDLESIDGGVSKINLEHVSPSAGRALLRHGRVLGDDVELERLARSFGNHALAVTLVTTYLQECMEREASVAAKIQELDIPLEAGRHARRVLEAFVKLWGDGPETGVLNIIGLFDRPIGSAEVAFLRTSAPIAGVTDNLYGISEAEWNRVLHRLRRAKVVSPASHHDPLGIDAHPVIRQHFAERLAKSNESAWQEAHVALSNFYAAQPKEQRPNSLREMAPLFLAVHHGCLAKEYKDTLDTICKGRILEEKEHYSRNRVGAHGVKLSMLAGFFQKQWLEPVKELNKVDAAFVMHHASVELRALGRMNDVLAPAGAALKMRVELGLWKDAVRTSGNLAQAHLALGNISEAIDIFQQCIDYADKSSDPGSQAASRAVLANSLNQAGKLQEALNTISEAESIHKRHDEEGRKYLHSLRGYYHCDILLALGRHQDAVIRAESSVKDAEGKGQPLATGLGKLALGRAAIFRYLVGDDSDLHWCRKTLDSAVELLSEDGAQDQIPRALIARATVHRVMRHDELAASDLRELFSITKRCGMRLFLCDYHLESTRLALACFMSSYTAGKAVSKASICSGALINDEGMFLNAAQHLDEADSIVQETGYLRREPEVLLERARLGWIRGDVELAREYLMLAKSKLNDIGSHEWDWNVKELTGLLTNDNLEK